MPEPETSREAFVRGQASGRTDERLDGHDDHFRRINGSIERLADATELQAKGIQELVLVVQRLTDKIDASDDRVIATAKALREAEEARRAQTEQGWSPLARWGVAVGIIVGVIGAVVVYLK